MRYLKRTWRDETGHGSLVTGCSPLVTGRWLLVCNWQITVGWVETLHLDFGFRASTQPTI
jgi:hypothetical protein